jgi:hypothetical protein
MKCNYFYTNWWCSMKSVVEDIENYHDRYYIRENIGDDLWTRVANDYISPGIVADAVWNLLWKYVINDK